MQKVNSSKPEEDKGTAYFQQEKFMYIRMLDFTQKLIKERGYTSQSITQDLDGERRLHTPTQFPIKYKQDCNRWKSAATKWNLTWNYVQL